MLKKFGMVSVGITAGLLAVAPMASATEGHHGDDDHGYSSHNENDGDDNFAASCNFEGGEAGAGAETGDALAGNVVTQLPIAGNNIANLGNCSEFLNDNFSNNDLALSILGDSSIPND